MHGSAFNPAALVARRQRRLQVIQIISLQGISDCLSTVALLRFQGIWLSGSDLKGACTVQLMVSDGRQVWDVKEGQCVHSFEHHSDKVQCAPCLLYLLFSYIVI